MVIKLVEMIPLVLMGGVVVFKMIHIFMVHHGKSNFLKFGFACLFVFLFSLMSAPVSTAVSHILH